jgi:hypothetical protein
MDDLVGFANRVRDAIDQMVKDIEAHVSRGKCKDFEEYRRMTGMAEGMRKAGDKAREVLLQGTDDEDSE